MAIILKSSSDYQAWSTVVRARLQVSDCWDIVDDGERITGETLKDRNARKGMAVHIIMNSVSEQQLALIEGQEDPKEMWDTLKRFHYTISEIRLTTALKEIANPKTLAGRTIDERHAILTRLNDEITRGDPNLKVHEEMLIIYLTRSLPEEYPFTIEVMEQIGNARTLQDAVNTLKLKEARLKAKQQDEKVLYVRAGQTTGRSQGAPRGRGTSQTRGVYQGQNQREKRACYCCGRVGHLSRGCWYNPDRR